MSDDFARRAHLSLDDIVADGGDALVKVRVTFLVFLSAAAPAKFVSIHSFAPLYIVTTSAL